MVIKKKKSVIAKTKVKPKAKQIVKAKTKPVTKAKEKTVVKSSLTKRIAAAPAVFKRTLTAEGWKRRVMRLKRKKVAK